MEAQHKDFAYHRPQSAERVTRSQRRAAEEEEITRKVRKVDDEDRASRGASEEHVARCRSAHNETLGGSGKNMDVNEFFGMRDSGRRGGTEAAPSGRAFGASSTNKLVELR